MSSDLTLLPDAERKQLGELRGEHVAEELQKLPPKCAIAILFPTAEKDEQNGDWAQPLLFRQVAAYNMLEQFHSTGPFYGELL